MKSGKTMEYSAWAPHEPNNQYLTGETEDCLHLKSSAQVVDRLWNDLPCRSDEIAEKYDNIKPLCQLF